MPSELPNHNNKCIRCGSKIDGYWGSTDMDPAAFCRSCDGYPCYCNYCDQGSFIVKENPRAYSIHCPNCGTHSAAVQVENGWG